ncbi:hypothetical protein ebA5869 [Aromatoleum aromaticum EbN1]|uniref:Uncharacterized protein n=1 Tax=Aromatoleum aromaticum (strain DSM 19018 / LMG 30748 / EbN1) TaxID=76114 RepID=Q5NZQ2_AROAE|nr:hypothetical protein ebA5869 [Aromatoleum aromaticum EbN1]
MACLLAVCALAFPPRQFPDRRECPGGRGPAASSKHGARCYQHKHALQANISQQTAGTYRYGI